MAAVGPEGSVSLRRSLAILTVGALLGGLLIWQVVVPVAKKVSDRYVQRGDAYLVAQDFDSAADQYRLALRYDGHNAGAQERLQLAQAAPTDIAQAAGFYREHGVSEVTGKLATAQQDFKDPKTALAVGVAFYQDQEYAYARYPLEAAVRLDSQYPEAWHYLGLTYQELAKLDGSFQKKADTAFATQNRLTPMYLPSVKTGG